MTQLIAALERVIDRSRAITADPQVVTLDMAGFAVRLVASGPAMIEFVRPAFAHLPRLTDDRLADLTVHMWDAASTSEEFPVLPVPPAEGDATTWMDASGLLLAYQAHGRSISILRPGTNEAYFVVGDPDALPIWDRPAPLRQLLSWWFAQNGILLAHSAAVSTAEGAALLVGPSGSGKSSTALGCLAAGMGYLGDDYVLIDPAKQRVWSLYGAAKLVAAHHDRYPSLMKAEPMVYNEPRAEKRLGWPALEFPESMRLTEAVRAFVLPVVTRGPECRLSPTTTARALLALAPTTVFQAVGLQQRVFELSTKVVRPLRPHRLELGAGVERVPEMLARLIVSGGHDE